MIPTQRVEEETEGEGEGGVVYRKRPRDLLEEEKEFMRLIRNENYTKVIKMLDDKEKLANTTDPLSWHTALHRACFYNKSIEICDTLLENGADIDAIDIVGLAPIQRAVLAGNIDTTQYLIDKGARYEDLHLIQIATRGGHTRMVRFLLSLGLDINDEDKYKQTALHYAAEKENVEIILLLLSFDARVDVLNYQTRAPLQLPKDPNIKKLFIVFKQHPLMKDYVVEKNLELETLSGMLDGLGDEEKIGLLDELEKLEEKNEKLEKEFNQLKDLAAHLQKGETVSDFWRRQYDGQMLFKEATEDIIAGKDDRVERQRNDMEELQGRIDNVRGSLAEQEGLMELEIEKEVENVEKELKGKKNIMSQENSEIEKSLAQKYENQIYEMEEKMDQLVSEREQVLAGITERESSDPLVEKRRVVNRLEESNQEMKERIQRLTEGMKRAKELKEKFEVLESTLNQKEEELEKEQGKAMQEANSMELLYGEERVELEKAIQDLELQVGKDESLSPPKLDELLDEEEELVDDEDFVEEF